MKSRKTRPNSGKATLIELYRRMLAIRLAELKILEIYPTDKIQSPIHLSIGQEAVSAGTCLALEPSDHIYGTYRGHGLYIARRADLGKMFAELYGKDTGCARGKGGSMHLAAPEAGLMGCSAIVAGFIPVAVGDALASRIQGLRRVAVAFFGDGAVDEGVFFESVNFALLKNLPVLFICENNNYAIHSKVADRHKQTQLSRICAGLGLAGKRCDGNDAVQVHRSVSAAVEKLRKGGPPVMLEFMTYRWYEHVGTGEDYQETYRDLGEKDKALRNDPLKKARVLLGRKFGVSEAQFQSWEQEAKEKIAKAVRFAESSPFPGPERLRADTYAATAS